MTHGRPQFVSAQPDEPWFVWQTHVYVRNFLDRGIPDSQITALFGIAPGAGMSDELAALRSLFPAVDIRAIEDERDDLGRSYPPSIQPHLIEKWLVESPQWHDEPTFFHDCDIIFRRIPDFASLLDDDDLGGACVLSDTTKYIGYDYLHEACEKIQAEVPRLPDDDLVERMCSVVGVDPSMVREQREAGGAQYLLTGVGPDYWAKVYDDSLALRRLFDDYGDDIGLGQPVEDFVQIWTAGMWAYLWNLWSAGHTTVVSAEMDFLFSGDSPDEHSPIIHMAGKSSDLDGAHFDKGDWREQNPVEAVKRQPYLFDHLPAASASAEYARAIHAAAEITPPGIGDCEPALHWRILAWRSGPYHEMWDVERVSFGFDGAAQIVDHLSSGCAGSGFEVGNAFAEGVRFWGGRPEVRPDAAPELYIGVTLDAPAEPVSVSLLHAPGEHRPQLVLVQRSNDGVEWVTTHVAPTPLARREQTILYRVPSVESAPAWRLVGTQPSQGFAWDVSRVRFLLDGREQRSSLSSSGDAGPSFSVDKALVNDVSVWGGRPDTDGRFYLTLSNNDGLAIDRIMLDQGADHWMPSVEAQYLSAGEWRTLRRFDELTPGVNELFLYDRPPTLLAEAASVTPPRRSQARRQPSRRSARADIDPFADRRILVLIAAYRDPELANTIAHALAQAAYPEHVRFAICNQYDDETVDVVDQWKDDPRFSIDEVPFAESQGCCWARHRTFALFDDEPYMLQIDAHTRFAARWDVRYIDQLESTGVELSILTTYPPRYRLVDGEVEYDTEVGVQRLTLVELRDNLTTLQKTEPVVDLEWPGPQRSRPARSSRGAGSAAMSTTTHGCISPVKRSVLQRVPLRAAMTCSTRPRI